MANNPIQVRLSPVQRAILDAMLGEDMNASQLIRQAISDYAQVMNVPFPPMPGNGGDRVSDSWLNARLEATVSLIIYKRDGEFVVEYLTEKNAAFAVETKYEFTLHREIDGKQQLAYLLGEWDADEMSAARAALQAADLR